MTTDDGGKTIESEAPHDERERSDGEGTAGDEREGGEALTYAAAGVDIDASAAATAALVGAAGGTSGDADAEDVGGYAGFVDLGGAYLGLATDGVGTKLLVAEALSDYSTIGIDCIAMNVNDLVAAGVTPTAFVDYLAVTEPDETVAAQVGEGLKRGAAESGIQLIGGETAVMPEVVRGLDLAGTCAGLASKGEVFPGGAAAGDALVGFPSSGIHSNGLTLARKAVTREHDYGDPFPDGEGETIGEVLLEPTRIYSHVLGPLRKHAAHAAAHVTGGGWTNVARMGEYRYEVTDPFSPQPVFEFVAREGNVSDAEMYSTFNMGTGFVAALPPERAEALCAATDGRVIGRVEDGAGVAIDGLVLE